ncbi:hypothetical protein IE81DRAFT_43318 [Ceraceosorus guamensis]|uniref:HNH domain-containing protein n=1 Tax=Ceraceosorus guamensis TaxID=1522189 RepID=A0A316VRX8_9BASI|nr:hypothetical protein IE81DRAFT_43318 [Ceraceosorus guamensis]PWN39163.1 hypothetical protein IE81DRAFT_43318 [Ceraceosorus guamensis]
MPSGSIISTRYDVLRLALEAQILQLQGDDSDVELELEVTEYVLEEVKHQGLTLDASKILDHGGSVTMKEAENHPFHSILKNALVELLGLEEHDSVLCTSEVLEVYAKLCKQQDGDQAEEQDPANTIQRQKKGALGECELCERCMMLTEHHLIPKTTHQELLRRGIFTKREMQTRISMLCRPCHSFIHAKIDEMALATTYNSLDTLLSRPDIYKWARYASKQRGRDPAHGVAHNLKNRR